MIKYFINAFKITNENIILATPLILFLLILSLYLGVSSTFSSSILTLLVFTTSFLMIVAFCAGWFFMVKKAIELSQEEVNVEEKAKKSFSLMKVIPTGIGEYFLPSLFCGFLYMLLIFLFILATYFIGMHFIGKLAFTADELRAAFSTSAQMKAFITHIPSSELIKLNHWNLLILSVVTTFSFLTMFWVPEILYKTKNAFLAFFKSLKFLFQNFFGSIILFVYISILNFLVSALNAVLAINPILYLISTIIYFYFIVYIIVLVFLYYGKERTDKIEIETQSDCDCGTDSVGEN